MLCQLAAIFIKASRSLAVYCLFTWERGRDREREGDEYYISYISYNSNAHYNSPKIDSASATWACKACARFRDTLEETLNRVLDSDRRVERGARSGRGRAAAQKQKDSFALSLLLFFVAHFWHQHRHRQQLTLSDMAAICGHINWFSISQQTLIVCEAGEGRVGVGRGFTQNNQNVCRPFLFLSKWAKKLWITMSGGDAAK